MEVLLHQTEFRAMGCTMSAWVVAADPRAARARLAAVWALVRLVDARLSRFRPDSELSRLNARSGQEVPVSPVLWEVLQAALTAARQTSGLFDPALLDALEAAGYDRDFDSIAWANGATGPAEAMPHQPEAWRSIRLHPKARSVVLPAGVRVDLGGIAKGWTADRAAAILSSLGPCLVDAGGDIAARGVPPGYAGWPVGVADPVAPEADLALLLVRDGGVATSGTDHRRWRQGRRLQHHIIHPRTGRPAWTDVLAVTTLAGSAAQAEVHAKVAVILGAEGGWRYLEGISSVEGLLVQRDGGRAATSGLHSYLWPGAGSGLPRGAAHRQERAG